MEGLISHEREFLAFLQSQIFASKLRRKRVGRSFLHFPAKIAKVERINI
jgi:hypothetical protein